MKLETEISPPRVFDQNNASPTGGVPARGDPPSFSKVASPRAAERRRRHSEPVELFPPRSRTVLRTVRSSRCSDFDFAQDDAVEKARGVAERNLGGAMMRHKKHYNLKPPSDEGDPPRRVAHTNIGCLLKKI